VTGQRARRDGRVRKTNPIRLQVVVGKGLSRGGGGARVVDGEWRVAQEGLVRASRMILARRASRWAASRGWP
jgi:hypothetical protein